MYQQSGPRMFGNWTHAPATRPSNFSGPNNNYHLMNNPSIRPSHSINPYLPPPPRYFSPHVVNTRVQAEPKHLANWCVIVKNIKLEHGDTGLIIELSGTLLSHDCRIVLYEKYDAGRLEFIISKNVVRTNNGVYHLVGPINTGYPNNLYRACLEANGIPRTWKYILTQFSEKRPTYNQRVASAASNEMITTIGKGIQELIKSYRVLRHFATIADRRTREHNKARKGISFVRYQFHQKLVKSLKIVNDQIIMGLKTILKHD